MKSCTRPSKRAWSTAMTSATSGRYISVGGWTSRSSSSAWPSRIVRQVRDPGGERGACGPIGRVDVAGGLGHAEQLGSDALVDVAVEVERDRFDGLGRLLVDDAHVDSSKVSGVSLLDREGPAACPRRKDPEAFAKNSLCSPRRRRVRRGRTRADRRHRRGRRHPARHAGLGPDGSRLRRPARSGCCSTPTTTQARREPPRDGGDRDHRDATCPPFAALQMKGTCTEVTPGDRSRYRAVGSVPRRVLHRNRSDRAHPPRVSRTPRSEHARRVHRAGDRTVRSDARAGRRQRPMPGRRARREQRVAPPARGVFRGRDSRGDRDRGCRRHAQRHVSLQGPSRRRRTHRALEPVLLENGEKPRGEPTRVRLADRSPHLRRVATHRGVRAHRAPRCDLRAAPRRRRDRRRVPPHGRRVPLTRGRRLPRARGRPGARTARPRRTFRRGHRARSASASSSLG